MREIALHILDIVQNSIVANATRIEVIITEESDADKLTVVIRDNGCGMSKEFLEKVIDPFTTKRTTRKVGLGIPLYKMAAENTGGSFDIQSEEGKGTVVTAVFGYSHIDRQPLGDIAGTMLGLFTSYEEVDFLFRHKVNEKKFEVDTTQLKNVLGDVSFQVPEVYMWLSEYLKEGEEELNQ
ncbi:MAG: sensor histidine kinase [Clostridia bacterium]|nr:sensor histidine kinase [Clostridia bacterium]